MLLQTYYLYGLSIKSKWPLPCPEQKEPGLPDVTLLEGSPSLFSEPFLKTTGGANTKAFFHYTFLRDGLTYIRWSGLFEFLISSDGHSIIGHSLNNVTVESFLNYLLGQTLSFAIVKQGIEPLHSTVVGINDIAVGLIGDCGYGKSTLAAAFLEAGYSLSTDDLLILKKDDGCFIAYPGFPRIKLFPKIAKELIGKKVNGVPMNNLTSKLILPLDRRQFASNPMPLKSIYVLTPPAPGLPSKRVTIKRLSQRRAFLSLLKNTFNTKATDPDRLKRQFVFLSQVVPKVPVKSLSYPRTLKTLPLVREAILNDIKT